jgi:hypothetical protein
MQQQIEVQAYKRKINGGCKKKRYNLSISNESNGDFSTFREIATYLKGLGEDYANFKPASCKYIMMRDKRYKYPNVTITKISK